MVQAANGMYYMTEEIEEWKVKNMQEFPTYGNCYRCYRGGAISTQCSKCKAKPLMLHREVMDMVQPTYQLI